MLQHLGVIKKKKYRFRIFNLGIHFIYIEENNPIYFQLVLMDTDLEKNFPDLLWSMVKVVIAMLQFNQT